MLRSRERDGRGQVIVLVALVFAILCLFAAFVIDVGRAYLERRQDVTAADSAVLAGASQLLLSASSSEGQIAQHAMNVARQNLRQAFTNAQWTSMWAGCTDPAGAHPARNGAVFTDQSSATACIHFDASFTRIRVRLPDQVVATTFGRLANVTELRTFAVAEAQVTWLIIDRGMPFAIEPGQGSPHDLLCIRADRNCSGPTNQATRILNAPLIGNVQHGTTRSCGTMGNRDAQPASDATIGTRAANNAAVGLDHAVIVATGQPRLDDDCGASTANPPNWVYAMEFDNLVGQLPERAGEFISGAADGLFFGGTFSDGGPPRLQRFPGGWQNPGSWPTETLMSGVTNYVVDDRPLWDYIRRDNTEIPSVCRRSTFDGLPDPGDPDNTGPTVGHMVLCLEAWNSSHGPLFDERSGATAADMFDIQFSPRAGRFPIVGQPGNNAGDYPPVPIRRFETGFVQTLYMSSTQNCDQLDVDADICVVYDPGDPTVTGPIDVSGKNAVGMAVFRIEDGMLPAVAQPRPLQGEVGLTR